MSILKTPLPPNDVVSCHECDLLHKHTPLGHKKIAKCIRCGCVLYRDKPNSVEKTLVLSLTSLILYLIATSFPLLSLNIAGRQQVSYLASGVIELFSTGMWELAITVLLTNLLFPLVLILSLITLLGPIWLNKPLKNKGGLFRIAQWLRPWAMMEVFMLGIFVAVVKLSDMADIVYGAAFFSFFAMIITSAAAASSFDPHALWDEE